MFFSTQKHVFLPINSIFMPEKGLLKLTNFEVFVEIGQQSCKFQALKRAKIYGWFKGELRMGYGNFTALLRQI